MQFPFFGKKNYHFLYTLLISKKTVGACVWHVENGMIRVDGISNLVLWDEDQEQSLFEAADSAIGSLGEIDATQVLLALPDDWVQGQGIHARRKGLLRSLTQKLELSSVGFVVTIEAVIAHLKIKSGQPLNCVCASVDPDAFIMAVITQSQSSSILRIGRSDTVTEDFLEGCSRLKAQHVPPAMVLYSLCESEAILAQLKHDLETHTWDPAVFVQPPKIELESPAFVLTAVTSSGGLEVLKAMPELSEESVNEPAQAPDFVPVVQQSDEEAETVEIDAHTDDLDEIEPTGKKRALLIVGGLIFLTTVLAVTFFIAPKMTHASITVKRKSSNLSGTAVLTVDTAAQADESQGIVQGALVQLAQSGDIEVPTTGQKKTGDPATGSVTVFNLTAASKTFKSGTALKSGKVGFETTEDVTVASASTGTNYEKIPGKASVKARATTVGEEGNIAKNTELSIGGFDSSAFIARSNDVFSGGASRNVAAVASKDQESATSQLTATLKQKIADELTSKLSSDQDGVIIAEPSFSGKKFSKSVGEESGSVSLTMNASASGILYSRRDALAAAAVTLHTTIPAGAKLDESAITMNRTNATKKSPTAVTVTLDVQGAITLPVDGMQYSSILAGKSISDARAFLDSQQSVESYTMTISPSFLTTFVKTLPTNSAKIIVNVE